MTDEVSTSWHRERARRYGVWLRLARRDPNYARLLLGQPLVGPVTPGVRATALVLGYRGELT